MSATTVSGVSRERGSACATLVELVDVPPYGSGDEGALAVPSAPEVAFEALVPSVRIDSDPPADTPAIAFAPNVPSVSASADPLAPTPAVTFTPNVPTISADCTVSVSPITMGLSINSAGVQTGEYVTVLVDTLTVGLGVQATSIQADANTTAPTPTLGFTTAAPVFSTAVTVPTPVLAVALAPNEPDVVSGPDAPPLQPAVVDGTIVDRVAIGGSIT